MPTIHCQDIQIKPLTTLKKERGCDAIYREVKRFYTSFYADSKLATTIQQKRISFKIKIPLKVTSHTY